MQAGAANATSANSTVTITATGVLDLFGNSTAIAGLSGAGTVTNSAASGSATLTVEATSSFPGVIQDGPNATTGLTVDGGGGKTLTLTGSTNTYSGTTTINNGDTLVVGAANATSPNSTINILGTGTLDLGGFNTAVAGLTGSGSSTVTNDGGTAATLTVQATSSFGGALADGTSPLALTVDGSATTFTLTQADNTYSGLTTIGAGATLQSGVANATSPNSTVSIAATGVLDLDNHSTKVGGLTGTGTVTDSGSPGPDTLTIEESSTFGGVIQDGSVATVAVTVDSTGVTLILTGNSNTYSGTTTINANDTLQVGAANATSPNSTVNDNGTLDLNGFDTAINGLSGAGTATNNATTNATLTTNGNGTFAGNIVDGSTNSLALTVNAGTLILSGDNTYSGPTTINPGADVKAGSNTALTANTSVTADGTLTLNGFTVSIFTLTGSGTVNDTAGVFALLIVTGGGNFTGNITGTHTNLEVGGTGQTLVLSGDNNLAGGTTIDATDTLQAGSTTALAASTDLTDNGTLDLNSFSLTIGALNGLSSGNVSDTGNGAATLTVDGGGSFAGSIAGANTALTVDDGANLTLTLTGTSNTYGGLTTIKANDTLQVGASNATSPNSTVDVHGTLDLNGFDTAILGLTGNGTVTNSASASVSTLTIHGGGLFSGTIQDGNGTVALVKDVGGTEILGADNTFSGATTIDAGTLEVDNGLDNTAAVQINSGGELDGTGSINSSATITAASGATVYPGDQPGVLTTGTLDLQAGSTFTVGIGGATLGTYSQDDVTSGTVTLDTTGAGVTLSLSSYNSFTPAPGDEYVIINNQGGSPINGTFAGLPEGALVSANFLNSGLSAYITYQGGVGGNSAAIVVEGPTSFSGPGDFELRVPATAAPPTRSNCWKTAASSMCGPIAP